MSRRIIIGMAAYNERHRIEPVIEELRCYQDAYDYDVVVGDDGSTDGTYELLKKKSDDYGWGIIRKDRNMGVGSMIRSLIYYGRNNQYEVFMIVSANGKTDIENLPRLFTPVLSGEYDYVKGSRYMKGGKMVNMPRFRLFAIPVFSAFVSVMMRKHLTDVTYLVNASKLSIYNDPDINLGQEWLERYGMEYYILYYVLRKYRIKEVPMTVRYPSDGQGYTKIKPITGWWDMIKPWLLLILRIRR